MDVDGGGAKERKKRGLDGCGGTMVWRIRTQYSVLSYNNNNTKVLNPSHVIMEQVAESRGEGRLGSSDRVGFQMALYHTRPAGRAGFDLLRSWS